jgi:hypothetical protein
MATQKDGTEETGGLKKLILAIVGTCFLGIPCGFFLAAYVSPSAPEEPASTLTAADENSDVGQNTKEAGAAAEDADTAENKFKGPFEIVQMPPIITNIAEPPKVWVRLEGNLLFDKKSEADKPVLTAKLSQHILAYLNTLKLTDIQGAGAIYAVSQDLDEIVRSLSDGEVQGVLLSGLVLE